MKITVWTKSLCPQCNMTKRHMTRMGLEFEEADLETNPEQLQEFKDDGLLTAPIVVVEGGPRWAGFQPALIDALAAAE